MGAGCPAGCNGSFTLDHEYPCIAFTPFEHASKIGISEVRVADVSEGSDGVRVVTEYLQQKRAEQRANVVVTVLMNHVFAALGDCLCDAVQPHLTQIVAPLIGAPFRFD